MKLAHTKNKGSWLHTLVMTPLYKSKTTGEIDLSLAYIMDQEPTLTINPDFMAKDNSQMLFNEVEIVWPKIPKKWKHLEKPMDKLDDKELHVTKYADMLIQTLTEYLVKVWDNSKPTIVFTSMGMDSRIITYILANIRREHGDKFLGDIHFRSHGTEALYGFEELMRKQGWRRDQYSIYNKDHLEDVNCHNMGEFTGSVNGYLRPTVSFWDDLVPIGQEHTFNCVQGLFGGEIFSYPLYAPKKKFTENRYEDLTTNMGLGRIKLAKGYHQWNDMILPYLAYEFLELAFRCPESYFKWIDTDCYFHLDMDAGKHARGRDQVRLEMCRNLGDTTPYFVGHLYNLVMSTARANEMKAAYHYSKFYQEFSHVPEIRDAQPWRFYLNREGMKQIAANVYELKLYGMAMTYEHTEKH